MPLKSSGESPSHVARTSLPLRSNSIAPTAEKLSEIIGAIYDCVLAPDNWEAVLAAIGHEFGFAAAALGVSSWRPGMPVVLHATFGMDADWIAAGPRYQTGQAARWGGQERLSHYPLDEPIVASQAIRDWRDNAYQRDMLEPRGIIDSTLIIVAREPPLIGYVGLSRHRSAGAIGANELAGLRLLGPHLRRAVTISNLFDMKEIEAATFSSVLDNFSFGVVLVDSKLSIVHANAIAARMLASHDPIESLRGTLTCREFAANAALERAVRLASDDQDALGARGIGIPARRAKGDPCVIHVLPLKRSEMRRGLSQRATAALFIAPAVVHSQLPSDALALLYDLTPAEKRVCELIAEGQPQSEIATTLGIARSTVKFHVLSIFEKTGCKRQIDLLKLAASLRAPV